jgi:hypothetical protein
MSAKTVFILGAGASKPYGYPTGKELRKSICELHENRYFVDRAPDALTFCERFKNSSIESIDLFLTRNPHYEQIGKFAIALCISGKERLSKFREDMEHNDQDWYTFIFNKLLGNGIAQDSYTNFNVSDFAFITFNYDRSFEYFIEESLINSFTEIEPEKIREHLRKLKIWHCTSSKGFGQKFV